MADLWALPPGVDFATGFVDGLLQRQAGLPPEALARVTVHANSQRMRRRIQAALAARGVVLMPRLKLVSDLADDLILADLPPMAPPLRRRLQLNQLIRALILSDPGLAPISAVQDLTESLFALMEEMDSEGVEPGALDRLDVASHADHWERSLRFLKILVPFFARSAQRGAAARSRIAALRLAEVWAVRPPEDPVIVAGSTASRGAISVLMEAVARLKTGAVVLPGFDFDLPAEAWDALADPMTAEDHPQYRFLRLAQRLDLRPEQVRRWAGLPMHDPARMAVISLALTPAPVTDRWLEAGQRLTDLPQALGRVSLIEATSPRQEAQALALILREAAGRGKKAALITPDRLLARRVTVALDRWRLRPDDSAGRPLALSAPGRLLRLLADLACERLTAARLLIVLKHPLVMSGAGRGPHLLLTREMELQLRRKGPVFPGPDDLRAFAAGRAETEAGPWAECLATALAPLAAPDTRLPLADWVKCHRTLAEHLARGLAEGGTGGLWDEAAGQSCRAILDHLAAEAAFGGEILAQDYRDLLLALLAEGTVRDEVPAHGDIQILGAREARECGADLVILAGLNEASWPALPGPDPWLNRSLRREAGLLLPERQIGLSAHDFQMAAGAAEVVLSRAARSDDSETVAARWLGRLTNLVSGLPGAEGPRALREMRQRGGQWLALAARIDQPGAAERADPGLRPAPRPHPVPPAQARFDTLSLTEVETLIRDPYAIYAKRILSLRPLESLESEPDAGDRGTLVHLVMEAFVRDRPPGEMPGAAADRLVQTAARIFARDLPFPVQRALWLARFAASLGPLLAEDSRFDRTLALERTGKLVIPGVGVTLTGRLDRADQRADGRLALIDYKTGKVPTEAQQRSFAKQLLATAVLAERGAFGADLAREVGEIRYVGISEKGKVVATEMTEALREDIWDGLTRLLALYRHAGTGFTARRAMMRREEHSDYDHLARFGEWDVSDQSEHLVVGGDDAQ